MENIETLIKKATLEKNSSKKEAYRAIKAEFLLNESSKKPKPQTYEFEVSVIRKLIKQREESASIYDANSRKDLADAEREQIKYLKELLPPEISRDKIEEAVVTSHPNGYPKKQMGAVIKEIKDIYPTADSKLISEVVKQYITE